MLLAQISDMHVKDDASDGVKRLLALPAAIGPMRSESSYVAILLTGDIAFSGSSKEYKVVAHAISDLKRVLIDAWGFERVDIYSCPGNHDCDFRAQKPAIREALLSSIKSTDDDQTELVNELVDVQSEYSVFRNLTSPTSVLNNELASLYKIEVDGVAVNLISLNSAWSSRLNEVPGSLRMPAGVLPSLNLSDEPTIALLHHPLNWYEPQDGKALSDWLDTHVDVALWGHEHRDDAFKVVRRRFGSSVQHFIGRPMDDNSVECGFRLLLLKEGMIDELSYRWRLDKFEMEGRQSGPLKLNPARQLGQIRFSVDFKNYLSDPGGAFKHPRLDRRLMLQDIFVEPAFKAYSGNPLEPEKLEGAISTDSLIAAIEEEKSIAVFAPEQAGKTTLAKFLIEEYRHRGITSIYLDGSKLRSANKGEVTSWIRSSTYYQYEKDCVESVEQVKPEEKIIIVDNVHALPGNASVVHGILQRVSLMAHRFVMLSAQNPAVTILAASHLPGDELKVWSDAKWFELMPLSNKSRGQLIRRWVATGRDEIADSSQIEGEVRRIKNTLDGAFGRGLSVKFPFFLLAVLQQIDGGSEAKVVVNNGSHGHIFEAMVTAAIEANVRSHDIGTAHDFLSLVAFHLWSTDTSTLSDDGFERLIAQFQRDHLVKLSHPALMRELIDSKVLLNTAFEVSFRYPYFYYYYLARWISQRAGSEESNQILKQLVDNIHTESSANVITFVAHLGHEKAVLEELMPLTDSLFVSADKCKLRDHAALAQKYAESTPGVELLGGDDLQASEHHHAQQDQVDDLKRSSGESLEDAFKYQTAMRIIQVLGQIMRSRAGSIPGSQKILISTKAVNLARRLMTVLYMAAELSADLLIEHASELFETEIKNDSREARDLAGRLVAAVVGGIAKGLVSRAAEVMATKDLLPLIEAFEDNAIKNEDVDSELIALCARTIAEQKYLPERVDGLMRRLPEYDVLSRAALAHSVARVLYLEPPLHSVRDAACAKLGIKLRNIPKIPHDKK